MEERVGVDNSKSWPHLGKHNQQCHGPFDFRSAHLVVTESVTRSSGQRHMDSVWGRQVFRTVSAALHEGAFSPGL